MWVISCILNVMLFSFICVGFYKNARWVRGMFGPPSPARSALSAVYAAALIFSLFLMIGVFPTFAVPITYRTVRHPVVVTYLLLGMVHSMTIVQLWDNNRH